jgi:PAS domain-containing protein
VDGGALRVICLPSTDHAFTRVVERSLDAGDVSSPAQLEDRLHAVAPSATVRPRELSGELDTTWYVYRDGMYAAKRDESWWRGPNVAGATVSGENRQLLGVNAAFAQLIGAPPAEIQGIEYYKLALPEAFASVEVLYRTILETGRGQSVVRLWRADGSTITCEFYAAASEGNILVWFRPVGVVERHLGGTTALQDRTHPGAI